MNLCSERIKVKKLIFAFGRRKKAFSLKLQSFLEILAMELAEAIGNFGWITGNSTLKNDTLSPQSSNKKLNSSSFLSKSLPTKKFFRGIWRRMTNKPKQKDKKAYTIVKTDDLEQLVNVCIKIMEYFETHAADEIEIETKEKETSEMKKSVNQLNVIGSKMKSDIPTEDISSELRSDHCVDIVDSETKWNKQAAVLVSETKSKYVPSTWVTFEENDRREEILLKNESSVHTQLIDEHPMQSASEICEKIEEGAQIEDLQSILTEYTLPTTTSICNGNSIRSDRKYAPSVSCPSTAVNEEILPLLTPTTYHPKIFLQIKSESGEPRVFNEDEAVPLIMPKNISPVQSEDQRIFEKRQSSTLACISVNQEQPTASHWPFDGAGDGSAADLPVCDKTWQSEMNMNYECNTILDSEGDQQSNSSSNFSTYKEVTPSFKSENLQSCALEPFTESETDSSSYGKIFRGSVDSVMDSLELCTNKEQIGGQNDLSPTSLTGGTSSTNDYSGSSDDEAVGLTETIKYYDDDSAWHSSVGEVDWHRSPTNISKQRYSFISRFFGRPIQHSYITYTSELVPSKPQHIVWIKKFVDDLSHRFSEMLISFLGRFSFIRTNPVFKSFLRK